MVTRQQIKLFVSKLVDDYAHIIPPFAPGVRGSWIINAIWFWSAIIAPNIVMLVLSKKEGTTLYLPQAVEWVAMSLILYPILVVMLCWFCSLICLPFRIITYLWNLIPEGEVPHEQDEEMEDNETQDLYLEASYEEEKVKGKPKNDDQYVELGHLLYEIEDEDLMERIYP